MRSGSFDYNNSRYYNLLLEEHYALLLLYWLFQIVNIITYTIKPFFIFPSKKVPRSGHLKIPRIFKLMVARRATPIFAKSPACSVAGNSLLRLSSGVSGSLLCPATLVASISTVQDCMLPGTYKESSRSQVPVHMHLARGKPPLNPRQSCHLPLLT